MKSKAQASIEFVILVGLLVVMFGVFLKFALGNFYDLRVQKEYLQLKDVSTSVKNEILTAYSIRDGYGRDFKLPLDIGGSQYNITLSNESLSAYSKNHEYYLRIPPVQGQPQKGSNRLRKQNGVIYLNQ